MVAGLRQVAVAAAATLCIALALPAIALAGDGSKCNASACQVYHEQGAPSAGRHQQPPPTGPTSGGQTGPSGSSTGGQQPPASSKVSRVLAHAGPDKAALHRLLNDSDLGSAGVGAGNVGSPSAFGAVSDLGAGPLALLAVLLGSALAFAVYSGVRSRRRRRPIA